MRHHHASLALLAALGLGWLGCATSTLGDPMGEQTTFEDSQRRYTQLVRWGELELASSYVDPAQAEDFLALSDDFEAIRVTDVETGVPAFDSEAGTASIDVTYRVYSLETMIETKVRARQEWRRFAELDDAWRVRPELSGIVEAVHGGPR